MAAAGSRRYPDPVFQCSVQAPLYGARAGAYRRDGCAEPCGLPVLPHPVLRRFFVPSGQHLYRPDGILGLDGSRCEEGVFGVGGEIGEVGHIITFPLFCTLKKQGNHKHFYFYLCVLFICNKIVLFDD